MHSALKGSLKNEHTLNLLGCSIEDFRKHIELQWESWMSWENHGKKTWHIDHIIPIDSFDLTKEEEQKKCFHYTNMQPMYWRDNLIKSNKI